MSRGRRGERRRPYRAAQVLLIALGCWVALGSMGARSAVRASASSACGGSSSSFGYGGGTVISDTNVSVCATGQVEVTFTSTPAPGCTGGPCGYTGSDVWQPQGGGDLDVAVNRVHGHRHIAATLLVGASDTLRSAVDRAQPNGVTTACSDTDNGQGGGFFSPTPPIRDGRLIVRLARLAPLFGTRCAGPLRTDLVAALPTASVSLARIAKGGGVIDLRSVRRFAAHGLSGVVRSTLVLHLGRAKVTHHPSNGSAGSSTGPGRGRTFRQITVTYRLERFAGTAVADVRTSSDPGECGPFDACGLSGAITVAPGSARGGSIVLSAGTSAARPRRDLLAAVGLSAHGNPAGIGVFGGGGAGGRGTVAADLNQGAACRDQTRLSAVAVQVQGRAGRLLVSVSPQSSQVVDPLRTRCPGPELGQHALALGALPRSALRGRLLTIALHGNAFSDGPYQVRTQSTLRLTLRRVRVQSQTFRIPSPPVGPGAVTQSSRLPS